MTTVFANRAITNLRALDHKVELVDLEFVKCNFRNCIMSYVVDPSERSLIERVSIRNCHVQSSAIRGAIIRDAYVENTAAPDLFLPQACVFHHVVLRGRIGRMMLGTSLSSVDPELASRFDEANSAFYAGIDWALDISAVETNELEIRNIPTNRIRRDPGRHILFSRRRLQISDWQKIDMRGLGLRIWLEDLLNYGPEEGIYVVPDIHPKRARIVDAINALSHAGLVEGDGRRAAGS